MGAPMSAAAIAGICVNPCPAHSSQKALSSAAILLACSGVRGSVCEQPHFRAWGEASAASPRTCLQRTRSTAPAHAGFADTCTGPSSYGSAPRVAQPAVAGASAGRTAGAKAIRAGCSDASALSRSAWVSLPPAGAPAQGRAPVPYLVQARISGWWAALRRSMSAHRAALACGVRAGRRGPRRGGRG